MPTPPIAMIAPTMEIAERAQRVAQDLELSDQVSFHVANLGEGLELARHLEREGAEVFIARRGTADIIRTHLDTPLTPIPITVQDLARALREAKQLTDIERPRIALFALPSEQPDLEVLRELMDIDLRVYTMIVEEEYLQWMVDKAIADKMDVVVAGSVATVLASRSGFPSLMLDSGPLALRTALLEARQIAYARRLEKTRTERLRTVVHSSHDGIILLDNDLKVLMSNPAALRILGRTEIAPGTSVAAVLPALDVASCLEEGRERNVVLPTERGTLVATLTPTRLGRDVSGAVVFFQPTESIAALGADIHKHLRGHGFDSQYDFDAIVGHSPQIVACRERARLYAGSDAGILLIGETGVGKELFAQAIHKASPRANGPFVAINCAALPSTLLESELFGYEEGAFTGAARKGKPGMFELAHRGTLFLDEVSELDFGSQLRLLRVLQERTIMRLGGNRLIPIDVRIIAASNKNLWQLVEEKKFRNDLFFRLNVLPIFIPPLRARSGDIPLLARHLLDGMERGRSVRLGSGALTRLERHAWPGNVRELANVMERMVLAAGEGEQVDGTVMETLLAPEQLWESLNGGNFPLDDAPDHEAPERERILAALHRCNGHRGHAAELLEMNRTTLYRKMRQCGIKSF